MACEEKVKVESEILIDKEIDALLSMENFKTFNLLYRSSRDGFGARDFHEKCDNISGTLTILKTNTDSIFGGYTTASWYSEVGEFKKDSKAFLFSLRRQGVFNNEKFNVDLLKYEKAIYAHPKLGPVFGTGFDIYVSDMSNKNYYSYSGFCHSYKCPPKNISDDLSYDYFYSISDDIESDTYLAGSEYFYVEEIEVFQVKIRSFKNLQLDSVILNENETKSLFYLTGYSNWTLLYRASRDGFESSDFHSKCDGYTPTLSLIHSEYESVFGGFTTASWDHLSQSKYDFDAYLLSLRRLGESNRERFRILAAKDAILTNHHYGSVFGCSIESMGCDIRISNVSNENRNSLSEFCNSYKCPKGLKKSQSKSYLAGSNLFLVKEIEVFTFTELSKPLIDSIILSYVEAKFLFSLSNASQYTLLYRASRDGFTAFAFHSKCDYAESTTILIKTEKNYVFGGYTQATWQGNGYKNDPNAYLFSLRKEGKLNRELFKIEDPKGYFCGCFAWS